ncbi:purine-nucleoside phosphorylase [Idiomarina seosinensis]|uniref:Purine nucleoside phosphorylase DeoD-type n=1 Tax=Idiomarina seosinensis TaxID=281739 RepID=A0A432ZDX6_9GAMM|nr:purine-nucleoside phosphorylase [Idiomarina seosinensis]RUO76121.1 purine-nucleoside phosphorylase [Idiomarina seosinensis]
MTTPHIQAKPGQFSESCLLPGDPLRAKFIAERYLDTPTLINETRNMLGYTGFYQGTRVSVMGTGMGLPSCMLYAEELLREFNVKRLIRVGSCGSTDPHVALNDMVLAAGASTDSNANRQQFAGYDFSAIADYRLLNTAVEKAEREGVNVHVGKVFSTDSFYHPNRTLIKTLNRMHILAIEMEAAGLYSVASRYRAEALAILTVSDDLLTQQHLSSEQRERSFDHMITVALETAVCGY